MTAPKGSSPIDFEEIANSVVWEMQEDFPDRTDKDCIRRGLKETAMLIEAQTLNSEAVQGLIAIGNSLHEEANEAAGCECSPKLCEWKVALEKFQQFKDGK